MFRLTDRRHTSDHVLWIITQEQADIKAEISGKPVSIVFDGTTRLGKAMAIVVPFVDDSFAIQPWLIHLQLLVKRDCTGTDQYPFSPVQYKLLSSRSCHA